MLSAVVARYNFQHSPERVPPGTSESVKFHTGNFQGLQIDEFGVYNDGLIVAARADTDILDAFLNDIYGFVADQFSTERVSPEKRHFESALVVAMDGRVSAKFGFLEGLYHDLDGLREGYGHDRAEFSFGGIRIDSTAIQTNSDSPKFIFERRLRVPFTTNQWFSAAPLRTKDHLDVLANLEKQLLR